MATEALKDLHDATANMSLPVMLVLLGRIHDQLQQGEGLGEAAERVREAVSLLMEQQGLPHLAAADVRLH